MSLVLPTMLERGLYVKKNKKPRVVSDGVMVSVKNINYATSLSRSTYQMTVCKECMDLIDIANARITNGEQTAEEIRKDPSILKIHPDQMVRRK